jgi:hypothetical protein
MEPNNGLTFKQEIFLTIRKDGQIVAIEEQNGTIQRYKVELANKADTNEIFGVDGIKSV